MKKNFRKIIASDFERGFLTPGFLICACGTAFMVVFGAWNQFYISDEVKKAGLSAGYHLNMVLAALKSEAAAIALPLLSTLPFGGGFLEEYKTRFERLHIIRCSRSNYILSKVIAAAVCGGAGVLAGIILITSILTLVYGPMELQSAGEYRKLFWELIQSAAIAALMGMLWASLGAFLGAANLSPYMAYGGPFVINYLLIILCTRYFPDIYVLNPKEWMVRGNYHSDNPVGIILFLLELCVVSMLLEGFAIWKRIK